MGCKEACCVVTKWWLITANVFVLLDGLAMLGVGIWLKVAYGDFVRFDTQTTFNYVHGTDLLLSMAVFTILIAGIGFYGSFKECRQALLMYGFVVLIVMILLITLGILGNVYINKIEDNIHSVFNKTLEEEYGRSGNDGVTTMADKFQEKYSCCGTNSYMDWQRSYFSQGSHSIVPDSCCKTVKDGCGKNFTLSEINQEGCWEDFLSVARMNYGVLNGLSFGIGFSLINPIIAAFTLAHYIKRGRPI